jgi:hypothetical protein
VLHSAIFLNNSNNQGIIAWVKSGTTAIYVVTAQGNPDGSVSYSGLSTITTTGVPWALRTCKIDNGRAGLIFSDNNGVTLGIVGNNGISTPPSLGTRQVLNGNVAHTNGVDCVWDSGQDNLIGVYALSSNSTVYNRYCEISGNNVNSPPYGEISMTSGSQVRCTTEGNNIIVTAINGTSSNWREAAWNKPFLSTGRYDDQTDTETLSNCSNHCGLQVQSGTILSQFEHNGNLQTYQATYSSGSSMNTPTTYGSDIPGKWGDLIKTDSGIGYTAILTSSNKVEIWEGSLTGSYELTYTSIFSVDSSNTEIQALMFGSVFAFGIGYASTDANQVFLIDSTLTRTDHFIGVAPSNILQGQKFNVDIALPLITLPREYPPGTFYHYGPYKYQVITHNQAVIIIESTTMQTSVI